MAFGRKKIEKPKNVLGYALYRYDRIFKVDLKKIIKAIKFNKSVNPRRADLIVGKAVNSLNIISEDISKDNFKTDYRSDKTRDMILSLMERLKKILQKVKEISYDVQKFEEYRFPGSLEEIIKLRQSLKSKMKDIESDYI